MRIMIIILTILSAGCATTKNASTQARVKPRELDELKAQNLALAEKLESRERRLEMFEEELRRIKDQAESASAPASSASAMPRPTAQPEYGPLMQYWGFEAPPFGCESGARSVEIRNETEFYALLSLDSCIVQMDGVPFVTDCEKTPASPPRGLGPEQGPRFIPPGDKAFLCLNNTGKHTFVAHLYDKHEDSGAFERQAGKWLFSSVWNHRSYLRTIGRQIVAIEPHEF